MKHIKTFEKLPYGNLGSEDEFNRIIQYSKIKEIDSYLDTIDMNDSFEYGYTPLQQLFLLNRDSEVSGNVYSVFKLMLSKGADPFSINIYGHDAYYYADSVKKKFFIKFIPNFLEEREMKKSAKKYNL